MMNEFLAQVEPWQLISTFTTPVAGLIGFFLHRLIMRADTDSAEIARLNQDVGLLKAAKDRAAEADRDMREAIGELDGEMRELRDRLIQLEGRE
ncbi:MAG: hypothetical protein NDI61_09270 [Bdellovibrionaceae bacterium]|nr:hypothetical protein [Pseudobdellovibrionaceae bacterium]